MSGLDPAAAACLDLARHPAVTVHLRPRLAGFTTFQLGGLCPVLLDCATEDALRTTLDHLDDRGLRWRLIGGGSNLLVSDAGLSEVLVRYASSSAAPKIEDGFLDVSAATPLDVVAEWCARQGWEGLTFATGIPGTVGGALAGNAGAFGYDVGSRLVELIIREPDGRRRQAGPAEFGFAYRSSGIPQRRVVVLRARWTMERASPETLLAERRRILDLRRARHPDWRTLPTAGSFFRNVAPTSAAGRRQAAGWYLEQAGAKAMREGGAAVFDRHANIIVKAADFCTADDVHRLALRMAEAVFNRFGLALEPEVQRWGVFRPGPSPDRDEVGT